MAKASRRGASRRGTKMRKYSKKARGASRRGASRRGASRKKSGMGRRCWKGGDNQAVFPADANDSTLNKLDLAQGGEYLKLHEGQHGGKWGLSSAAPSDVDYMLESSDSSTAFPGQAGGAAINLASSAPPGYTGMLDDSLRATARVTPLDESMGAARGMSDQAGGRRRKMRRRTMRRSKSMRKQKKSSRRRKMRGGSAVSLANAQSFGAPGMLLSPNQEAEALAGMNPEWKLATNPGAFKPAGM